MVDEHYMVVVYGTIDTYHRYTLEILKDKVKTDSIWFSEDTIVYDVTACPGSKRFGVYLYHYDQPGYSYLQMYSISDSGKAVAGQLLKVMDDVQWNGFSYSEEFNGFLFVRDAIASNFELLMFKNLCLEDQIDGPETIINAQCFDDAAICRPYAALHLGGNFFAISLFNDIQETRPLYVIEVLGKYSYNKLQTLQASTTDKYHFFSDLLKDDQNNMYASKRKYSIDYGTEKASVSVYSWSPRGKNMTFAADLLTGKKLVDHPYVGFISQIGNYLYFTDSFSCQAFEYKMRYDE